MGLGSGALTSATSLQKFYNGARGLGVGEQWYGLQRAALGHRLG